VATEAFSKGSLLSSGEVSVVSEFVPPNLHHHRRFVIRCRKFHTMRQIHTSACNNYVVTIGAPGVLPSWSTQSTLAWYFTSSCRQSSLPQNDAMCASVQPCEPPTLYTFWNSDTFFIYTWSKTASVASSHTNRKPTVSQRAFSIAAPRAWNSLPADLRLYAPQWKEIEYVYIWQIL